MRRISTLNALIFAMLSLFWTGCVSTSGMHQELEEGVAARTGYTINWYSGNESDAEVDKHIQGLIADTLDLDDVVHIALLNNRYMQAMYESAGVARADLIQAGLLTNPELDIHVGYPVDGGHDPDLGFSLALDVLDVFQRPLRRAVAESVAEETQIAISREVLLLVVDVQQAFYMHQAALQLYELRGQVTNGAQATYEAAVLLQEAGNIPALQVNNERLFFEQMKLELAYDELAVLETREVLNQLMGLWGESASKWSIRNRLPSLEALPEELEFAESKAIDASLDLALIAQELETIAYTRGVVNASALLPHLKVGVDAEREGEWEIGPGIGFPVPLFDRGQGRKAAIEAQIRQKQATYYGKAVDVRAATRTTRQQLVTSYGVAWHYQDVIVPLSSQVTIGVREQFNAMQAGVFRLLVAQQEEIKAGVGYIESLRTYWLTRTTYEALLKGVMRTADSPSMMTSHPATAPSGSTDIH